ENVAQTVERRMPLAEGLIDDTATADLVLQFLMLFAPIELFHGIAQDTECLLALDERREDGLVLYVDLLGEVRAVEQALVHPGTTTTIDATVKFCCFVIFERIGHLRSGRERAQVEAGQPGIRAKQLHVERMMLPTPQN